MKRDPRSIWFKARPTVVDAKTLARAIAIATSEIYREIESVENDLRNSIPDDTTALQNDIESLEKRVSDIEYSQRED